MARRQGHAQARRVAAHERDEEAAQLQKADRVDIARHARQRDRQRHLAASVVLHAQTPAQKKTAGSSPIRPLCVIRNVDGD
ncbi:hypothetical protein EIB18_09035 [Caulobacter vibrioides]|uniref:Uncharacterized protein n=1 Tax=Caulobacter vibrioides (strain NA1000 / CB15N) TaxID=565050 RepID=A0A0H3CA97_CAUVN|nr:hypothetical protein [Caulobacter vibrioides]YP_002517144.1 hypothetical protein CCNA_01771 [Caulobacter vibrioides NA1000]ACL95236.1 hypothetical protein CCNA_01771 [Caulobacter vibrioides NA1000]AZH12843.1 hypothetical protein EIB18_09035 [Caulobacter vibrioides]